MAEETGLRAVPPPNVSTVRDAEDALGCRLSDSLQGLYAHTNGLLDEWGYAYVLSISELVEQNRQFRGEYSDVYMSFNDLVLFGQLGNGDMFFQPSIPEANDNVFVWDHEDDSRNWYARDIEDAIRRFTSKEPR
jgi:SMI1/KNR4 family protein SUKH-1